jgi:hypothetical protein
LIPVGSHQPAIGGQIMKMLTNVDLFAPPKRARNTKEWFERAKLVVVTTPAKRLKNGVPSTMK